MNSKTLLISLVLIGVLVPVLSVLAQATTPVTFKTLVGIPGLDNPELKFGDYINALYGFSISIAALLSVIKIIIAGMKYMMSDIVNTKGEAIKDIQGALFGLLVVISAVLILREINPRLAETNLFFDPIKAPPSVTAPASGGSNQGPLPANTTASTPNLGETKINCVNATCAAEHKTCKDSGGKVHTPLIRFGNTFNCVMGEVVSEPRCINELDPYTGYSIKIDCSVASTQCPAGSTYIPPESGKATAKCYKPFPKP